MKPTSNKTRFFSKDPEVDDLAIGSPLVSRLALLCRLYDMLLLQFWKLGSSRPRYHFSGLQGSHYERPPYRNHSSGAEQSRHVSRLVTSDHPHTVSCHSVFKCAGSLGWQKLVTRKRKNGFTPSISHPWKLAPGNSWSEIIYKCSIYMVIDKSWWLNLLEWLTCPSGRSISK